MDIEAGQYPAVIAYRFNKGRVNHENTVRAYAAGRRNVPHGLAAFFA
jgi:glycerophosphoryl diester phosphodiesterase